ncbi:MULTISPECIES: hypothetical protein [unclassified Kitasatospora]|uniref:hypothetical protein n=1 Tax=unclassified Kitasatospora TaxID=2633591 RepID=UPI001F159BD9|nr:MULTISPECIES: hypothetical protein [unclassified Kitasatospora]
MDLRPELQPPPVPRQRLAELSREIERIADLTSHGEPGVAEAIDAFNEMTGHEYAALDFAEYQGARSLGEFAMEAARPFRPQVLDISRGELAEIVRRVLAADPESDYYLRLLEANVSHPRVTDLIFHPSAELRGASGEQIVDAALSYRVIPL